jgi:protein-tyrosine phosphatase
VKTELYWLESAWPGRLAITPRPRGGDWLNDEIRGWRDAGVDIVVSLLETEEIATLDLAAENELSRANRIEFRSLPIADRGVPKSRESAAALVDDLVAELRAGKNVAVHCRQGIGRAAVVAASVLVRLGIDPGTAIEQVGAARGRSVPETPEQRQWIANYARLCAKPLST